MDNYTKAQEEREIQQNQEFYDNSMEFFGKFILSPDIHEYEHLDKNLATTNLRSRFQENERVRNILNTLHILNKYRIYEDREVQIIDKETEEPRIEVRRYVSYMYPLMVRFKLSEFYSFVTTSAATDGHLMKALTTKRFEREESVEDKTDVKPRWGFWPKKQGGNTGGY